MTEVSVVVAAHARPERLRTLLAALAGEAQVVVAADGASPQVLAVLAEADVRVVRLDPGRGPAAARNAGWRAATGRWIAFTDDDCLPAPGWPAALLAAAAPSPGPDAALPPAPRPPVASPPARAASSAASPPAPDADSPPSPDAASPPAPAAAPARDVVVQGRVAPLPAETDRLGPFARTLRVESAGPFYQTANMLYPRALLERLGGFDEAFPAPAGEDTDLAWRALAAGAEVRWAPDALVWHAVHELGWRGMVADAPRWGAGVGVVKAHPGLRRAFHHRIFWQPAHEQLLLAVAAVALARRTSGASLGAAVPWLLTHRPEHPTRAGWLRALPAHLAVDVAEVAAMARGSARARTLLL